MVARAEAAVADGGVHVVPGPVSGTLDVTVDAWASFVATDYADRPFAASSAGDLDADGHGDLAIGAPLAGGYKYGMGYGWFGDDGAAFVFYGPLASGTVDLRAADATFTGSGEAELGYTVGAAGDGDGDGVDDLLVGSVLGLLVQRGSLP